MDFMVTIDLINTSFSCVHKTTFIINLTLWYLPWNLVLIKEAFEILVNKIISNKTSTSFQLKLN